VTTSDGLAVDDSGLGVLPHDATSRMMPVTTNQRGREEDEA
jgi:hypothetical protein